MVMHPKFEVYKIYEVKVFGAMYETLLKKLRAGVVLEDGFAKPKAVRVIKQLPTKTWLEFRLGEGKNREIRKMCEACGLTVDKLKRVAIGGITVEGIRPGGFRYMNRKDIMEGLGLSRDGKKVRGPVEYISLKKTVNLKKRKRQQMTCTPADDENFTKFRRENYFETLKKLKLEKERKIEQDKMASFEEKEKAHQDRKVKKQKRVEAKERQYKDRPVHARIEK
jgi:23S rRNA pseudouridine2605 synthase